MATPGAHPLVDAARRTGVRDPRVLDALRTVDRRHFVPAEHANLAATDVPIAIADEQVTTQPSLVAMMVAALELDGHEVVLEVGTGLGYQAAVLAQLAARVVTIERHRGLAAGAERNLAAAGIDNVEVVVGDGSRGWPERAPYDAVVVAAAFPRVPDALVHQLRDGGRLVQPVGPGGAEEVTSFRRVGEGLERVATVTYARFVRLVGEHGHPIDPTRT